MTKQKGTKDPHGSKKGGGGKAKGGEEAKKKAGGAGGGPPNTDHDKKGIQHDFGHGIKIGKDLKHHHQQHEGKKNTKYDDLADVLLSEEKERKAHKHDHDHHHPVAPGVHPPAAHSPHPTGPTVGMAH